MFHSFRHLAVGFLSLAFCAAWTAQGQFVVGITDRQIFTDTASFSVPTNAGFTYEVTLNGTNLPAGVTHVVNRMDYYDLVVRRTQLSDQSSFSQLVRFIVRSSQRGSPETGLIQWTPYPPIPSGAGEFAGGQLHVVTPQQYPAGLEIPVIAWMDDGPGNGRRVNGNVTSTAFVERPLPLRRGVGHAFMPAASSGGTLTYDASIRSVSASKSIQIDASTTWSNVAGVLPADAVWPANSRIHVTGDITISAGNTLTIEAGTIVLLDSAVNIASSGRTLIRGTFDQPVVLTSATTVAPERHTGAWGGFLLRGASAELIATGAIMTGAGASPNFSFSPGASHRSEQALLLIQSGARVMLTNCYLVNQAGQIANGLNSDVVYDHCLLQRAITAGEYEGGTVIVEHSAVIEFPSVDGEVDANIASADYDAIYFTTGTHILQNSLFGFAKDDAIDSGSGGLGTVVVSNCWVESALHEALAWSGEGRQTWSYDSVLMNCGQGIECGWSTGTNSPLCYGEHLLSLGNSVGGRYGDNYEGTTGLGLKTGFLTVTNSFFLYNYRDVWGQVWDNTWNYRVARMDLRDNWFSVANTNHPDNALWDPPADGRRLAEFRRTPAEAAVGVGFANWTALTLTSLTNGIPLRLSTFATNNVSLDYTIETPEAVLSSGTLTFRPGETVKRLFAPITGLSPQSLVLVSLSHPVGCEVTTVPRLILAPPASANTNVTITGFNSSWRYLDDGSNQGTAWRQPGFNDAAWRSGLAQLGYGDSPADETTTLRRTNSAGTTNITFYFRRTLPSLTPADWVAVQMRLLRDDAGVVYLNGTEVYRSPNLPAFPAAINYLTRASSTGENSIDTATLSTSAFVSGTNWVAVEIHQESITSSDVSFDFELVANLPAPPPRVHIARFGEELILYWDSPSYRLQGSEQLGPGANWTTVPGASPIGVLPGGSAKFFRLIR